MIWQNAGLLLEKQVGVGGREGGKERVLYRGRERGGERERVCVEKVELVLFSSLQASRVYTSFCPSLTSRRTTLHQSTGVQMNRKLARYVTCTYPNVELPLSSQLYKPGVFFFFYTKLSARGINWLDYSRNYHDSGGVE